MWIFRPLVKKNNAYLPEFLKTGLAKKVNSSIISVISGPYLLEKKDLTNKSSSHMQHLLDDTKSIPQV